MKILSCLKTFWINKTPVSVVLHIPQYQQVRTIFCWNYMIMLVYEKRRHFII